MSANATDALAPLFLTRRLALRAPTFRDAPRIASLLEDGKVAQTLARVPQPYTLQDAERFVYWSATEAATGFATFLGLEARGEGAGLIGLISLERAENNPDPVLGYWLGAPYWGRGFMSEAVEAMIAFAKTGLRARRLKSGYFKDNTASARIQEKCGFAVVGESRVHALALGAEVAHIDTALDLGAAA